MTYVVDDVNAECDTCLPEAKENVLVTPRHESKREAGAKVPPGLTRTGLRFHFLVLQLKEKGWTQSKIAGAIGCHQTLISDWQRGDFGGRQGIGADIIDSCMSGPLKLHPDFFFSDYKTLPEGRRDFVELDNGMARPVRPGEADAALFPIDLDREREKKRARELESAVIALREQNAQLAKRQESQDAKLQALIEMVASLTGTTGAKPKVGTR